MTEEESPSAPRTLEQRLNDIVRLEQELVTKAHEMLPNGAVNIVDFFILGATQRTLSQSRGFRTLIESKNFPSATILLRTQIDTAMRINGLTMMADVNADINRLFKGERTFDRLMSATPVGGGKPERLTDAFLKKKLAEAHPWIAPLYEQTSDFVHLTFRHLFAAITDTDSETQTATLSISGCDPKRDEMVYYEVCDSFFRVSRLTSITILAMLMMRHHADCSSRCLVPAFAGADRG
ncbi:hypothetical protein [Rhizobium ruizarguesonis]|uniref:hypothetical protein n=1 Tax=Rhizobium ruizarguesonis TaxID=2081791 RepID=UPI00102FD2C2|nr:hypothetical protein [Rhizobium ruizarguesonis]NKL10843.1 hypothetical protein [Rhizobium leguminosarum bv. viciae]NEJ01298.1 hypothetical protein [Rhizobium ruizarguesonis]NEJ34920.1 hypothetical protein [Rhizobium ruizarguesonis]TAT93004.1 hypothetical protein ELI53_35225 [Rhizobium ruizarguesonis]TAZ05021.1 hypothetical protein ELH77_35575 [Rhizobium ruizarguesonis]